MVRSDQGGAEDARGAGRPKPQGLPERDLSHAPAGLAKLGLRFTERRTPVYKGSMGVRMSAPGLAALGGFFVEKDGRTAGDFCLDIEGSTWRLHSHVDEEFRRQGISTAVYDHVEALAISRGARLLPSPCQSADAVRAAPRPAQACQAGDANGGAGGKMAGPIRLSP